MANEKQLSAISAIVRALGKIEGVASLCEILRRVRCKDGRRE